MLRYHTATNRRTQNVLLLKDDVGRSKPETINYDRHTAFGKAEFRDREGAQ